MPELYLVTGGAGFISFHIVERLVQKGQSNRYSTYKESGEHLAVL